MIKAPMECTKRMFTDEKYSKAILAKYTRQSEAEVLDQSDRFALDIYVKDPTVTASSIQPIVQQAADWQQMEIKTPGSLRTVAVTIRESDCWTGAFRITTFLILSAWAQRSTT